MYEVHRYLSIDLIESVYMFTEVAPITFDTFPTFPYHTHVL